MPLVHKSGGFVVNLYEGEDLFAIAGIAAKSFPIFSTITRSLGNRNHKWSTGHPPSHLHFLKRAQYIDDNDDDNGDNAQHIDNNNKGSLPSRFSGKVMIEGGGVFRNIKNHKMFRKN